MAKEYLLSSVHVHTKLCFLKKTNIWKIQIRISL